MENMENTSNIDELFDDLEPEEGESTGEGAEGSEGTEGEGQGEGAEGSEGGSGEEGTGDGVESSGEEGTEGSGEGEGTGEEGSDDIEHLSGIERYLSQFDIEGGMIQFDDGTEQHFTELEPEKQAEILANLHEQASAAIEEKYGLDETEIGLINYLRQSGKSIDEVVEETVNARMQQIMTSNEIINTDIDKLEPDLIYKAFLLRSNPEATPEQVEDDLEKAKAMNNYDKIVENLRGDLKREQEYELQQTQAGERQALEEEIEAQRTEVVKTVQSIDNVDGFRINDDLKNMVLDNILTVDDDGDSKFMVEVFGNPERLFKAAFWYMNGPDIVKSREEYWKKQKSEAFKRGQEAGKSGKVSFSKEKPHQNNDTGDFNPESLDDLY